jgi:hypothetical protein
MTAHGRVSPPVRVHARGHATMARSPRATSRQRCRSTARHLPSRRSHAPRCPLVTSTTSPYPLLPVEAKSFLPLCAPHHRSRCSNCCHCELLRQAFPSCRPRAHGSPLSRSPIFEPQYTARRPQSAIVRSTPSIMSSFLAIAISAPTPPNPPPLQRAPPRYLMPRRPLRFPSTPLLQHLPDAPHRLTAGHRGHTSTVSLPLFRHPK